jgi:hypothetical protein
MARYDHLPIYRTAFDLAVQIEQIVRYFSRYHKYTLGVELRYMIPGGTDILVCPSFVRHRRMSGLPSLTISHDRDFVCIILIFLDNRFICRRKESSLSRLRRDNHLFAT